MSGDTVMTDSLSPRAMPRQGMALPIALAAIVVVGLLITGVFFAATQEYRVGRNTLGAQRALHGAEVGLSSVIAGWNSRWVDSIKVGQTKKLADTIIDQAIVYRQITRPNTSVFTVTSTAVAGSLSLQGRALKRLSATLRMDMPDFRIMGAITSRGRTEVSGFGKVSGTDSVPAGWDCPPGGAQAAALVVNDSAVNVTTAGNYSLNGTPKIKDSTDLVENDSTFNHFGGFSYDSLARLASKVRTVGTTINSVQPYYNIDGVTCDETHADNWGDYNHTDGATGCDNYYPIVHLQGATQSYRIDGNGGGQGILLVDGNLTMAGNFQWVGLILVRGAFLISGTGGGGRPGVKVLGAVAAMNKDAALNKVSGTSSITFSRCVINQITSRYAVVAPMRNRSWADLSF